MNCEFCQRECKSEIAYRSHKSLCPKNPNRKQPSYGTKGKPSWNKGLVGDPRCSQVGQEGKPHSEETKLKLSKIAKERKLGGYRPGAGRSKKFKVVDSYGNEACLQSTYELKCSEILNGLNIKWTRPSPLRYDDKLYYPDFYLPEFDLYLDPKNDYLIGLDKEKIDKVMQQNGVKVIMVPEGTLNNTGLAQLVRAIA